MAERPPPERRRDSSALSAAGALDFERDTGERSTRLADLVRPTDTLDLDAIAARIAYRAPLVRGSTVWRGIRGHATPARMPEGGGHGGHESLLEGAAAASALRIQLEAAVARSLEGSRRVAVMTGGGVDSAALLGLAVEWAKGSGATVFAVTLDFEAEGDDRPHMRALEAHLRCEVVRVKPEDAVASFALARRGVDATPLSWPGAPTILETARAAKEAGADRIVAGAGGDFLFDGSPFSLARLARRGRVREAIRSARAMSGFAARPRSPVLSFVVRPLLGKLVPLGVRRARFRRNVSVPDWAGGRLRRFLVEDHHRYVDWAYRAQGDADARFAAAQQDPEVEATLWDRHQQEVATGLPRVDPFMDPGLVRFVTTLSPETLVHGATRRGLFREAIRGLVPESLRVRTTKAGFEPCFTRAVNAAGGFEPLRDLARVSALADAGLVEPRPFMRAFDELASRPIESWGWGDVWPALMVESFLRAHASRAE